jgi:hypothetical protein
MKWNITIVTLADARLDCYELHRSPRVTGSGRSANPLVAIANNVRIRAVRAVCLREADAALGMMNTASVLLCSHPGDLASSTSVPNAPIRLHEWEASGYAAWRTGDCRTATTARGGSLAERCGARNIVVIPKPWSGRCRTGRRGWIGCRRHSRPEGCWPWSARAREGLRQSIAAFSQIAASHATGNRHRREARSEPPCSRR